MVCLLEKNKWLLIISTLSLLKTKVSLPKNCQQSAFTEAGTKATARIRPRMNISVVSYQPAMVKAIQNIVTPSRFNIAYPSGCFRTTIDFVGSIINKLFMNQDIP